MKKFMLFFVVTRRETMFRFAQLQISSCTSLSAKRSPLVTVRPCRIDKKTHTQRVRAFLVTRRRLELRTP